MSPVTQAIVGLLLALVGGAGAVWFTLSHVNRKTDAEAAEVITKAASATVALQNETISRILLDVANLRTEVQSLRVESATKSAQIMALWEHLELLEAVVRSLGGNVPPRPSLDVH